jgi:hypothetical protein
MFASKFNNSNSIYQLSQQQQLYNLNNSIDSNASYNSTSNSLLTAANTIVFNNSSSLSSNSFISPSSANQLLSPPSISNYNHESSFTNNILNNYQQNNAQTDLSNELDFDLHFITNSGTNVNETQSSSKSNGSALFRVDEDEDDDIFINDNQEDDPFDEYDDTDDNTNPSIISLNNGLNNRMKEPSNTTSILHNKLTSFQFKQANKSMAVNFPIEAQLNGSNNSNDNGVNLDHKNINVDVNKNEIKSNFPHQNSLNAESLSPSSANNLASTTPSNLNGNLTDSTPQNSVPNKYNRTYMKMQLMKKQVS